jgi:hypothetical protein
MRKRRLIVLAALVLPAAVRAADGAGSFEYKVTFDDGVPGIMRARVEKSGEKHAVTCNYAVSQEEEMGLPNMPMGSWRGTDVEKVDKDAVRALCLRHYDDRTEPD